MKRLALLVVALAILCLFVACKEPEPYHAPELNNPYVSIVNDTGMTLRLNVFVTENGSPTPTKLKYTNPSPRVPFNTTENFKISGYCILRTETRVDEVQHIAYQVDVISNVMDQTFTLENKVYDIHVTYNSNTNELEFNPVERQ